MLVYELAVPVPSPKPAVIHVPQVVVVPSAPQFTEYVNAVSVLAKQRG